MERIQLQFHCHQNVDEMALGAEGKPFCQLCERSLHDFRGRPSSEVMTYIHQHEGCGIFDRDQLYNDPLPLLTVSSFRKFAVALSTFFAAETALAQSPQPLSSDTVMVRPLKEEEETHEASTLSAPVNKPMSNRQYKKWSRKLKERSVYRTDYGIFYHNKFPFLSFRNKIVLRPVAGFWIKSSIPRERLTIGERRGWTIFSKLKNKKS